MKDYDAIVIGGGINGLTAATYLAKSGMSVAVFERRGQCGAHCDTLELGMPGFLHNLHATWLITAMSPAMEDLDLVGHGLELVATDVAYAKEFLSGRNCLLSLNPQVSLESVTSASSKDAEFIQRSAVFFASHLPEVIEVFNAFFTEAPSLERLSSAATFLDGVAKETGLPITSHDLQSMTGFEGLEVFFDSEELKTTLASLAWIGGLPPIHRRVGVLGALMLASLTGTFFPVHQATGGSHAVTHSLVRAAAAAGVEIWTTSPVDRILVENGRATGVRLENGGLLGETEVRAPVVISDLTVAPTFLRLIGEDEIGVPWATKIKAFVYDEQVLFGVYYALSGDPVFRSAERSPGIQRSFMGFFGGETLEEMRGVGADLISGVINDTILGNWFIPTRADPAQAPEGMATSFVWVDVPPNPRSWHGKRLPGWDAWPDIKEALADEVTDAYERYAPGFKDLVLERFIMTPPDQERNNPSAVKGNWIGGSMLPEQVFANRPVPGLVPEGSASRTFIPGLYLANSIHPGSTTWLCSGYLAAKEVAVDAGTFDPAWWKARAFDWYLQNMARIPTNRGVDPKWLSGGRSGG